MSDPLVSVIIPSFNRPLFLRKRSIPSLLRQTYRNWELFVVGDGPTEDSLRRTVESFADPRMRYVQIPRPDYSGLSAQRLWHVAGAAARNYGVSLAHGQLIAPLDDDDEFLPDHLKDCVAYLTHRDADLVYGAVLVRNLELGTEHCDHLPWADPAIQELFCRRNIMFHSSVCYSARFAHLRYPLAGDVPADYGLWLAIRDAGGRFASLERPQSIYYGDALNGTLRVSVPSLPPLETYQAAVADVFASRHLSNGGVWCRRLEQRVAEYIGVPHAIAAASGDAGLRVSMLALRELCPEANEVIVPSYTFPATVNAVLAAGLTPVFCDIDARTLCITPATVEPLMSRRTAAVLAVHAHGNPADMPRLEQLCGAAGVMLVSDAAAAMGACIDGRHIGSFGHMEVFSLSGTKVLSAGEGGIICCRDDAIADRLRELSRYGIAADYSCSHPGINSKLSELAASLAVCGLPYLDGWLARRLDVLRRYRSILQTCPQMRLQELLSENAVGTWKDLALVLSDRKLAQRIIDVTAAYRIHTRPYYRALHQMAAYREFPRGPLLVTEQLSDCVVCIPLYADIRDDVVDLVGSAVREALI